MNLRIPGPLIVALCSFAAIIGLSMPGLLRREAPVPATPASPPVPVICDPPWSCGRLAQGEAGMKPRTWYLKYEDVDGPKRLEIVFREDATCSIDGVAQDCATIWPTAGSSSTFKGAKSGEVFVVSEMGFTTPK